MYRNLYISSYRSVEIKEICSYKNKEINIKSPYWISVYDYNTVNVLIEKYNIRLDDFDIKKSMLIVSYGAQLESLEYNKLESTYYSRGSYVGFPVFDNFDANAIYFYSATSVPIINTDVAGYSPDYSGKYR